VAKNKIFCGVFALAYDVSLYVFYCKKTKNAPFAEKNVLLVSLFIKKIKNGKNIALLVEKE
jgi:hypothetical protein